MAQIGITIESINFSGESVDITFNPFSGGSINLGTQTIPYDYLSTNYEGNYSIYIPSVPKTCELQVGTPPSPTPSPTSSVTPSVTPSITITPTPSITPTVTPSPSVLPFDPDAAAFLADVIATGGTVDATISAATDTLYTELKSEGLYNKIHFYPFIGGTAASHALYGDRSSGTTYDITWVGGVTHGISGSTGNGTNGLGQHSLSRQIYSPSIGDVTIGCSVFLPPGLSPKGYDMEGLSYDNSLIAEFTDGKMYISYRNDTIVSANITNGDGVFISSLTGATNGTMKGFRNSSVIINTTQTPNAYTSTDSRIMKGGGIQGYSPRTMNFTIYGEYLTDTEVSTLTTIINDFQTALGRNTF